MVFISLSLHKGQFLFLWENNGAPERHPRFQRRLIFLQNARYCTVDACTRHKINPASKLCGELERLETTNPKIGDHYFILYKKSHELVIRLFWFFDFVPVKILSQSTNKILEQFVNIKTSLMETLIDPQ